MNVARAGWTSASFFVYAGALTVLISALAWLGVISTQHSQGAFAGWSVLFFCVAEACAVGLRRAERRVAAGVFAFVSVGLFAVLVGAFLNWFGWLHVGSAPFSGGFHWGALAVELLTVVAALVSIRFFHFPLLGAIAAGVGWFFVTDLISGGGSWSAVVTILVGCALFLTGLAIDQGPARPYGFWVHVTAGLTVGGGLLYFWHSSDAEWSLIIVASLVYISVGAALRRSTYAVLGAVGLALATAYFSLNTTVGLGGNQSIGRPQEWVGPVAYLCLGFFLALIGLLLSRRGDAAEPA